MNKAADLPYLEYREAVDLWTECHTAVADYKEELEVFDSVRPTPPFVREIGGSDAYERIRSFVAREMGAMALESPGSVVRKANKIWANKNKGNEKREREYQAALAAWKETRAGIEADRMTAKKDVVDAVDIINQASAPIWHKMNWFLGSDTEKISKRPVDPFLWRGVSINQLVFDPDHLGLIASGRARFLALDVSKPGEAVEFESSAESARHSAFVHRDEHSADYCTISNQAVIVAFMERDFNMGNKAPESKWITPEQLEGIVHPFYRL